MNTEMKGEVKGEVERRDDGRGAKEDEDGRRVKTEGPLLLRAALPKLVWKVLF